MDKKLIDKNGDPFTRETVNYENDADDQLTREEDNKWTWDSYGNEVFKGVQVVGNRVLQDEKNHYAYDDEGNLTIQLAKAAFESSFGYKYDHHNRLIEVTTYFSNQPHRLKKNDQPTLDFLNRTSVTTYKYDALGNRIEKATTSVDNDVILAAPRISRFAHDGQHVWADLDANNHNAIQTVYLRGDKVDQLFGRIGADGAPAWYFADRQGSILNVVTTVVTQGLFGTSFSSLLFCDEKQGKTKKTPPGWNLAPTLSLPCRYYAPTLSLPGAAVFLVNGNSRHVGNVPPQFAPPPGVIEKLPKKRTASG